MPERLSNLPKITRLINKGVRILAQPVWLYSHTLKASVKLGQRGRIWPSGEILLNLKTKGLKPNVLAFWSNFWFLLENENLNQKSLGRSCVKKMEQIGEAQGIHKW